MTEIDISPEAVARMLEGVNYATRDPETGDDLYPGAFAHITADELVEVSMTLRALSAALTEAQAERAALAGRLLSTAADRDKLLDRAMSAEAERDAALAREDASNLNGETVGRQAIGHLREMYRPAYDALGASGRVSLRNFIDARAALKGDSHE